MAFTIIQAGTSLQFVNTAGSITTLTLPSGVTLDSTLLPRWAIFGRYVVLVNSVSRPVIIDGAGVVRVLSPKPPRTTITLSGAAGGSLTGTYTVKQTFRIKDADGNIITQSDYGLPSAAVAISGQYLKADGLDISEDDVTETLLYRTTTGGSTYFPWIVVDGNTQTSIQDDLSDASLQLLSAATLGTSPDLSLVAEWRGRLWGVSKIAIEFLRFSEASAMYAWPTANSILIPRLGEDTRGIISLIARREALGVGRRNSIHQITGTSSSDFRPVKLSENVGVESNESVKVYRDVAYWLWKDGVYQWDSNGIKSISDNKVRSWFSTDTYFNRARFQNAFAIVDPIRNRYKLFLAAAGSSVENRWVEYDIENKTWWGPHKCDVNGWTPTCSFVMPDANDTLLPTIGTSNGFMWKERTDAVDDLATGIAIDVDTKFMDGSSPDIDKHFGELSILGKAQSSGTIAVVPTIGYLNSSPGGTINYDMTKGRQRLRRLGNGKMVKLNLQHSAANEPIEIYGIEIPFVELGRR